MSRRPLTLFATPLAALVLFAGPVAAQTPTTGPPSTTVPAPRTGETTSTNGVTRTILGVAEPRNAPGQTLLLQDVRIAPGAKLTQHSHQGTQLARVTRGTLTYSLDEGTAIITKKGGTPQTVSAPKTVSLRSGDVLVENAGLLHHAENKGRSVVVLDVTALIQTGAPLATPAGNGAAGTRQLDISADLQSQSKLTRTVGADNDRTYGWNDLVGTATVEGQHVDVDLQGTVDYTKGSGPFGEFVTFTFADGSVLATRMQGVATAATDGSTTFAATMGIIGGTGTYANAVGTGVFTGSRTGALGAPVQATFALTLTAS